MSTALVVDLVGKKEAYASLAKIAREADANALAELFGQAQQLHQTAWVSMAIICGEAMVVAKRDGVTAEDVAGLFDCHPTLVRRAAKLYDYVVRPRIEEQGDQAAFPIKAATYYEAMCDAADFTGRPALDFVKEAEDNPRVSAAEFRRKLIEEGSLPPSAAMQDAPTRDASKALAALRVLSKMEPKAMKRLARMWDDPLPELIEAVTATMSQVADLRTAQLAELNKGDTKA